MKIARAIDGLILGFAFLVFFVQMILGVGFIFNGFTASQDEVFLGSISSGSKGIAAEGMPEVIVQPLDLLKINAESAISVESNLGDFSKVIFESGSDKHLPIASLTKLMTAVVVLENYNSLDTWQVDEYADLQDPMKQDVKLGDTMTVESFLKIMLVGSSNKSAYALSELVGTKNFIELMNQKAKDLGLKNTFFVDPTGLNPKNISTVGDLVKLTEYILRDYPIIAGISKAKELYVPGFGKVENTNQLLDKIPEIVFSKTGFTAEAKGCLLLVVKNRNGNNFLINVVLGADDRFSEMEKLINWSSAVYN